MSVGFDTNWNDNLIGNALKTIRCLSFAEKWSSKVLKNWGWSLKRQNIKFSRVWGIDRVRVRINQDILEKLDIGGVGSSWDI